VGECSSHIFCRTPKTGTKSSDFFDGHVVQPQIAGRWTYRGIIELTAEAKRCLTPGADGPAPWTRKGRAREPTHQDVMARVGLGPCKHERPGANAKPRQYPGWWKPCLLLLLLGSAFISSP